VRQRLGEARGELEHRGAIERGVVGGVVLEELDRRQLVGAVAELDEALALGLGLLLLLGELLGGGVLEAGLDDDGLGALRLGRFAASLRARSR
jgi:hypothetical protein